MGIFHDAYLFDPESFLNTVVPYREAIEKGGNGYSFVRNAALDLYDRNPQVRSLASEYGGWDKKAILTQLPSDRPRSVEDIAFWFVIFLYGSCSVTSTRALGLGGHWRLVDSVLRTVGWNDTDRHLLIKGSRFAALAQRSRLQTHSAGSMEYWDYLDPFSQGGQAGWLDFPECQRLLGKITQGKDRLSRSNFVAMMHQ